MKERSRRVQKRKEKADSLRQAFEVQETDESSMSEESFVSGLDPLKEGVKQLKRHFLLKTKQVVDTLDELQSMCNTVAEERNRVLAEMEKGLMPKQQKRAEGSGHKVFSVVTCGHAWNDELVFTVLAENDVWAKEFVRQWLDYNGREHHRIDKVLGLVSQNVRAIVNVGAVLQDV
jgi:hypothetical protein